MKGIHFVTFILLVIGGLNRLLLGLFNWELGQNLFGGMDSGLSTVVYVLIGLSALYEVFTHKKTCKLCEGMGKGEKK